MAIEAIIKNLFGNNRYTDLSYKTKVLCKVIKISKSIKNEEHLKVLLDTIETHVRRKNLSPDEGIIILLSAYISFYNLDCSDIPELENIYRIKEGWIDDIEKQ